MQKRKSASGVEIPTNANYWRAEDARRVLAACERSCESIAGFARRHGLSPKRLYWWRQRLSEAQTPTTSLAVAPLIPVTLRPERGAEGVVIIDGDLRMEVSRPEAVSPEWVATVVTRIREGGA